MLIRLLRWIVTSPIGQRRAPLETTWAIIGWWEARRLTFNVIVGATGVVTGGVILLIAWICDRVLGEPVGLPDPPILAVLGAFAFAVVANICYTGGWIAERIVRRAWPEESERMGQVAFALGLLFSVAVTLAPAVLVAFVAVAVALARWFGYAGPLDAG